MSTLVDHQIIAIATDGAISPFNKDQVNPASYDVLLDDQILVELEPGPSFRLWETIDLKQNSYTLQPGGFVLACTKETFTVSDSLEAIFCLKSSRGREGFDHSLAAYIDPGFSGQVTLELRNCNRYTPLTLTPGMRIGQIRFATLDGIPKSPYNCTGRYNGQTGPTVSKG
jgi:dCTP deaminase